jgi:hypothetical protein
MPRVQKKGKKRTSPRQQVEDEEDEEPSSPSPVASLTMEVEDEETSHSSARSNMQAIQAIARLMGSKQRRFTGDTDISDLRHYLEEIEILAQSQELSDEQTCFLAKFFTLGPARAWCNRCTIIVWQEFKNAIYKRFSLATDMQRAAELISTLAQRKLSTKLLNDFQEAMDSCEYLGNAVPSQLQVALLCTALPKGLAADVLTRQLSPQDELEFVSARMYANQGDSKPHGRSGSTAEDARPRTDGHKTSFGKGSSSSDGSNHEPRGRPWTSSSSSSSTPSQSYKDRDEEKEGYSGCFTCGSKNHRARDCHQKRKN